MSADRRLKTLKLRQKSLIASMNAIKKFVDEFDEEHDPPEVPVRLECLCKLWTDFNNVQSELETTDEASIDSYLKTRLDLEEAYYRVKGFLLSKNKQNVPVQTPPSPHSAPQALSSSHVRLPDVKLPVFNGKIENWLNFHDLFISLVHSSAELSNIQKFYYLRSSLSDDALKLIQSISISAVNYPVAWSLLVEHYQNTARLKQSYVDSLFEFPSLKKESAAELHSMVERFEANVKILHQLGEKTEYWDILLVRMLSTRLDPTTRRDWEEYSSMEDSVSFNDLTDFIQRRVSVLQTLNGKSLEIQPSITAKKPTQRPVSSHGASQVDPRKCVICTEHHPMYLCANFTKLSVDDKEKEVRRHHLCRNCLRKGHVLKECTSSSNCRKCGARHHTQLCSSSTAANSKSAAPQPSKTSPTSPSSEPPKASVPATIVEPTCHASAARPPVSVLLATAKVIVVDDHGNEHTGRALLDSGSECCFISERFSKWFSVRREKICIPISGIGQSTTKARYRFASTIRSRVGEYSANVEFIVLPKITIDLPSTTVDTSTWDMPSNIQLADPSFSMVNPIDLILGAEVFFDIFKPSGRITLGDDQPVLINSVLGWVVSGRSTSAQPRVPVVANVATVADVHRLLEKFWSVEDDSFAPAYSVEEAACEAHFSSTVARTPEGRYVVRLPLKPDVLSKLSDNRRTALRRFHLLESRFSRNPDLFEPYKDFIEEYHSLGHMQRVHDHENPTSQCYHLPHHAVMRDDSTTTKLRVVFDASCKTPTGPSLNDALMVGPIVQEDIRSIIMRARKHPVMLIADIKQMYRQVLVDPQDTPLQRIVWRTPDQPMETYELKTVTYGTASAPFLATRVLKQLAHDERSEFPAAAEVLEKDFYVDDLFTGGKNSAEVTTLRIELEALLSRGGFTLRKWASNDESVLEGVPLENRAVQPAVNLDGDQVIKTLGLYWEPTTDHLRYKIHITPCSTEAALTKRMALSLIARLFDPLGLVGPAVTTAKIFMQSLWTLRDEEGNTWGWDKELPTEYKAYWNTYQSQLPALNELRIQRCIMSAEPTSVQFHLFSDASERAYGACAYVRSTYACGSVRVALLTSKSKVAPLKKLSIPRLELCAALMAAELYEKISTSLQLKAESYFWVDSTTVLCWLEATPSSWNTFVANRTSKIQLATQNSTWNHVSGQQNPADILSRGTSPENLLTDDLWWHGPQWLQLDQPSWPTQNAVDHQPEALQEARKATITSVPATPQPSFVDLLVARFSNYNQLLRAIAWWHRFMKNCRLAPRDRPEEKILTTDEIKQAEENLIRLVQKQTFVDDWKRLEQSQPVSTKSRIKWFHPFLSAEQLIRIGGRLDKAQRPYDNRHQILLPASHPLSALLIRYLHERYLHAAPQLLLNLLRQRYWIIGARSLAKRVLHSCIPCFRARPKMIEQFMGELPTSRVTASRPFSTTGVDYWGPILLQPIHRRAAARKVYVSVFICFCTKAVHLELVADLSTAKFLQALRRFVSRRGLCTDLHSDNGRNFLGAANELRKLVSSKQHKQALAEECNFQGIRWHFTPPKGSHFGGLWESAINSAQKHFFRVLGTHTLAYDDMETLLCQIECCLNCRPLVALSDDPTDYEPLTPGHFLVGSCLKAVPDVDYSSVPMNRLKKWEQVQKLLQDLWKRWHHEYLATLQARTKWCNPPVELKPNQLVLLKDETSAPMNWITARIHQLHPGTDNVVRVVTVQTPTGKYVRPVAKISLLPITSSSDQE